MHRALFLALSILVAPVAGQQTFVVPSRNATRAGVTSDTFVFNATASQLPARVQLIYNVTDIPVSSAMLKTLSLRRAAAVTNANPAATATLTLDLSVGPVTAATSTTTFATNHGASPTTVFSGNVVLPPMPQVPGPAPFVVTIPFTTFFPYTSSAGSALIADIRTTAYTPLSAPAPWYLDAEANGEGARVSNPSAQSSCKFSNGQYNNVIGWAGTAAMVPGGRWYVSYQNVLPNAPAFAALGTQGAGGNWGGVPLPVAIPGAPGCTWNISVFFGIGIQASSTGVAPWPQITLPNDPALAGGSFFDHVVFVDPPANPAGVVAGWSSKWTIGTGIVPEAAKVYRTADTAMNPTGSKVREPIVAQFGY